MTSPSPVDAYCQPDDLLLGNIPAPDSASPEKYCVDGADEIDSRIGHIYQTRIDIADTSSIKRPARLLLKRINVWLATGRLLMATDAPGEENQIHAYALKLVNDASAALDMIANGSVILDGAVRLPGFSDSRQGPVYANADPESNVEAFYNRIANPTYVFPGLSDYERPYPSGYRGGMVGG